MTTRKHTLAASLIALLAAAPAMAQQEQTDQQAGGAETQTQAGQATQQPAGADQQQDMQQAETVQEGEMPQAATPEGRGLSDLAEVDTPPGEVGAGQTIMLDIEGFSQTLYERGFRQGYLRGIADARERLISEMRQARSARREGAAAQEDRMESVAGGQTRPTPGALAPSPSEDPIGRVGTLTPGGEQQMAGRGTAGQGGAIIVLPPGMDAQTFIDRVMEMNEAAQR